MYGIKAVIIGSGMAGLATGISLRQAGYEVEIYEK
ncbi:MAG: NAD(P)-binding protein, partial [Xenococcaceae cyanobacterium]